MSYPDLSQAARCWHVRKIGKVKQNSMIARIQAFFYSNSRSSWWKTQSSGLFRHPHGSQRHTQQEFNVQPHSYSKGNTEKSSITGISCLVCTASRGELWSKRKKKAQYAYTVVVISMGVMPSHYVHIWLTTMVNQKCVFGGANEQLLQWKK